MNLLQVALQVKREIRRLRFVEIVHIAAELAPVAKVGGLADVLHGLSRALLDKNHNVEVVLPKYDSLELEGIEKLRKEKTLDVLFAKTNVRNTVWRGVVDQIPVVLIESHASQKFFDRGVIYGCEDDIERFGYFCLAALAYLQGKEFDVVHLHDWHTALLAPLVKELHKEKEANVVFTIHNLAYQGHCSAKEMEKIGWKSPKLKEARGYNLLKGGIVFADHITTVSPHYAREILTTEMGGDLKPLLKKYQDKISGILNGIDYSYWNPHTDPFLPTHYSIQTLSKKQEVKAQLRQKLSLSDEACPLISAVTRLVPQKGPELIKAALLRTLEWGGQFVLLGSVLDEETYSHFYNLKRTLAGSQYVHLELSYNEELSHLVYGASDLLLVPSLFEPCGLTQQIAMRYGAVPLVRETGGLIDTVFDGENGYSFGPPTAEAIHSAIDRALSTWYHHPKTWQKIVETGMKEDFSWDKPAEEYLKIYRVKTTVSK